MTVTEHNLNNEQLSAIGEELANIGDILELSNRGNDSLGTMEQAGDYILYAHKARKLLTAQYSVIEKLIHRLDETAAVLMNADDKEELKTMGIDVEEDNK